MHDGIDAERRKFLQFASSVGFAAANGVIAAVPGLDLLFSTRAAAQTPTPAVGFDHTIRIAPIALEIAPNKVIQTTGYNGSVPGPALRLREGMPVKINVINESGYPNLIHWHGLYLPSVQDGASEEGSPIIQPGPSHVYSFTPKPAGTRWYHSHAMAMTDLTKSTPAPGSTMKNPNSPGGTGCRAG